MVHLARVLLQRRHSSRVSSSPYKDPSPSMGGLHPCLIRSNHPTKAQLLLSSTEVQGRVSALDLERGKYPVHSCLPCVSKVASVVEVGGVCKAD